MNERFSINETFVQPYSFPPANWKSPKPSQRMAASVNCKKAMLNFQPRHCRDKKEKKERNETKRRIVFEEFPSRDI